jgi:Restriction endonuclease
MQGYAVTETGQAGADGGIDLVLTKGRERTLVQCKHWRAQTVGVAIVRELYGAMAGRWCRCWDCRHVRSLQRRRQGVRVRSQCQPHRWASTGNSDRHSEGGRVASPVVRPGCAACGPAACDPATANRRADLPDVCQNHGGPQGNARCQYRTGVLGLRLIPGLSRDAHELAATNRCTLNGPHRTVRLARRNWCRVSWLSCVRNARSRAESAGSGCGGPSPMRHGRLE